MILVMRTTAGDVMPIDSGARLSVVLYSAEATYYYVDKQLVAWTSTKSARTDTASGWWHWSTTP